MAPVCLMPNEQLIGKTSRRAITILVQTSHLLHRFLTSGSSLVAWMNDSSLSGSWLALAATCKSAVNIASNNWDSNAGCVHLIPFVSHSFPILTVSSAYKNSDTDGSVYPRDSNAGFVHLIPFVSPSFPILTVSNAYQTVTQMVPSIPDTPIDGTPL